MDTASNTVAGGKAAVKAGSARQQGRESRSASDRSASSSGVPPRPTLSQFIDNLRATFSARFHLLELEAKRAAWSAAYMLALAVGAALLGVTAWLILVGALIVGAVSAGVHWLLVVAVAIALHVGAAFFLVRSIRGMVENLTFEGTRRTLARREPPKATEV
ncbi:MAG: hypothetical protein M3P99_00175 [Pseudomonadota bacterium]|nr:hypothetical protein [Pseudomonadota bacterium]